ncbi:glycoside hydrolase family 78 protein [Streptomyces sp. NBC_00151]|uniref:glycoside hydrolase family 78 protein n=1 Tax=Streptomyces sp. NBC_00151 TaxID=2975669 RepID=UPI002DDAD75F|nr:glycoside hydrolase family 78 protein [Streptomyces sp. NBC_00151]WRZ43629.1 glycoside hydrolase family 78 protein [Streptomyces sp. NBC_00151]
MDEVSAVRFEHRDDPLGIGEDHPRLSWQVASQQQGRRQAAYELTIGDEFFHVDSTDSVLVPWPARPLASREAREVRVRVIGTDGEVSDWSDPVGVERGLTADDWKATLIEPAGDERGPAALLRRAFVADGEITRARLYITAHGLYVAELNGEQVGDDALAPGWTSYHHRLRYQTYDVTRQVRAGENAIGVQVADGWWRGRLGFVPGWRDTYGSSLGLLAQLEIDYADGRRQVVPTDEGWRSSTGPVRSADLYEGETYDATMALPGWSSPGFDDQEWGGVHRGERDPATLVAPSGPPVRAVEERVPVDTITTPSGRTVLDFGQNLVGRLRIRVRGRRGATVTLRHAEVLESGELGVRPLRTATATDRYVLAGDADGERWEPSFTLHGFRYAEVSGDYDELEATAVVYHSDMRRTGWFECSDPLLNRLHENVVWGMRGNFVDVPTDCPQRDERLGWTGDIQVFAPTAAYLFDCAGLLTSWLADLAADQTAEGVVPLFVPRIDFPGPFAEPAPTAGWSDAAVIVPWVLHQRFGDAGLLRRQYPSMRAWVDGVTASLGPAGLFDKPALQLGDWLDPAAPPDAPWQAETDAHLVATAYRAHVAGLLSRIAAVIGEEADAAKYDELASGVRQAFHDEYVTQGGRIADSGQTGYALALEFALLPDAGQRARAARQLVRLVREKGHKVATGFLGTPVICDALTSVGAIDDAYQMLLRTECPSWLYPVTMGATTVWERWDSMLPDGSVNPGEMTSFNHYALGAVADWMHRVVAGLGPGSPGYRSLRIEPRPGGRISWARTAHRTPYGLAEVAWERAEGELRVDVTVPTGSVATVVLPGLEPREIESGRHRFVVPHPGPQADREWHPSPPFPLDDMLAEGER